MCDCFGWIPRLYRERDQNQKELVIRISIFIGILAILITGFSLLGVTVNRKVGQNDLTVFKNSYTTDLSEVIGQGTYTRNVGDTPITFNRTFATIHPKNITCLSYDKVEISTLIAVQYVYDQSKLISIILLQYGTEESFQSYFEDVVTKNVIDTCSNFTTEQFFTSRQEVEGAFSEALTNFVGNYSLGISVQSLQLVDLTLPTDFTTATNNKLVILQSQATALAARASQVIIADAQIVNARLQANIIQINANRTANANIYEAQQISIGIINQYYQQGLSLLSVKTNLGLNETGLLEYVKSNLLRNSRGVYATLNLS